eukprot:CAMPEP_0183353464 /NCGR_PEP_ID=MMETSP0164_2-20130417/33268_1 /TAXON_ID=221442 /ORGANISM="Coccolithus pelagicus ssp braarudi, Strain PLY182g" /LENGTH=157 /DNA_ID=CAMNT_0025526137 /DNA_START=49 /DNA_END=522 /DNA_ORIENTATION=-
MPRKQSAATKTLAAVARPLSRDLVGETSATLTEEALALHETTLGALSAIKETAVLGWHEQVKAALTEMSALAHTGQQKRDRQVDTLTPVINQLKSSKRSLKALNRLELEVFEKIKKQRSESLRKVTEDASAAIARIEPVAVGGEDSDNELDDTSIVA